MSTDPFDDANPSLIGTKDFVGTVALIWVKELVEGIPSTIKGQEGKTYDAVVCDVHVIGGKPTETDRIDEVPSVFEDIRLAGATFVGPMKSKIGKKPQLGRMEKQKSSYNTDTWIFNPLDPSKPEDAALRKQAAEYLANLSFE